MTKITVNIFFILFISFLLPCKQLFANAIDSPVIKSGMAKLTGRIIGPNNAKKDNIFVNITVQHPISGENIQHKIFVDPSGRFSIDVNLETDISLIGLYTSLNLEKSLLIKLTSGGITNIDIAYNPNLDIKSIEVKPKINQNDMIQGLEVMNKMMMYTSGRPQQQLYDKNPNFFLDFAKSSLLERLKIVKNDTLISKELKSILSKDYSLILYSTYVFDYEKFMLINYQNTNEKKSKTPVFQKINKLYYSFLKDFNLNDSQYLNCFTFPEFQKEILQNEKIGLPEIGESDVFNWLAKVKSILSELIGFDNGQYYDILAANAYARQLNEEVRPLTERQKTNIMNYWKNGEITKILLKKNQQVVELDKLKSPAIINEISTVPAEKVIETIIAKYKKKVVLIDFWATWCAPCLEAMEQFRSTKNNFRDKDIVFVYLTNKSSPRKLWGEKIKGIGNEHYYLTDSQWNYLMKHFGFDAIPSYVLYNKNGEFVNKFISFPGNEKVKEMINSLL